LVEKPMLLPTKILTGTSVPVGNVYDSVFSEMNVEDAKSETVENGDWLDLVECELKPTARKLILDDIFRE
ncbi:MAG: hypothetical protein Q4C70_15615, partial [Planctomycetia bacterium]|nr:hypothetical protein [Planctomycetia bacterium]